MAAFDLGSAPYRPVQLLQARLRRAVAESAVAGVLLLLEHEPVITLGSRGTPADLRHAGRLRERGVALIRSERGGQATLHAPGQLVSYPIVPIPCRDLGAYVRGLEETLILLLADLDVTADRREGRPGVYVGGRKIASVGLRCQRWVASHGTSLNVSIDLSLFDLLVSCGEPELRQTSLQAVSGRTFAMDHIKTLYVRAARQVFGWDLSPLEKVSFDQVDSRLGLSAEEEGEVPTAGFEPATPGSGGQCSIP
jgi:lipoate-protein ligase B